MHRRTKRRITAGFVFAILLVMITACSGNRQPESSDSTRVTEKHETENKTVNEEVTNETVPEETVKETNEEVNENVEDSSDVQKNSDVEEIKEVKETKAVSNATGANVDFETVHKREADETVNAGEVTKLEEIKSDRADEQTVFDDGDLIIKLTELNAKNNALDYELKFSVENKTDQNLKIIAENSLVNDYYINFGVSDKVTANNKIEIKMIIYKSDLEKAGIETLKTLEFNLLIFDADTYEDYACSETVIVPVSDNNQ